MGYVDYQQRTGDTGLMMIRVHDGTLVEFWLKAGMTPTWFQTNKFTYWSPHGSDVWYHGYNNGDTWQLMGSIHVSVNGNVSWEIAATGTQGFRGPTTQTVWVQRATAPATPTPIALDQLGHNSFRYRFSGNSDGGSPIIEWQIGYGLDPWNAQFFVSSPGTTWIGTNFPPGSRVYAWVRGRNAVGWSNWSYRLEGVFLPGIRVKINGTWRYAIPYVKVDGVWRGAVLYAKKNGAWAITTL